MKKYFLGIVVFFFLASSLYAQSPQLLNYQGVARNAFGNAIPNKQMNIRLSIRNGSSSGTVVYSETRLITTNSGGLYTIQIGSSGTSSTIGTLAGVNWLNGSKYLQVELDPEAGNSFIDLGTTQLVSVPYSFVSGIASPIGIAGGDLSGNYPNPLVANGAITSLKLADASVSTIKIVDQSVTTTKLADGAVTDSKIVSISGSKIIGNIPGIASNVSGIVSIANGGTSASNAASARTNLGLGNVDNTSDLNKPISTATQLALDLKENVSNKSTTTSLGTSDVLYPTQNAVKSYVDAQVASATIADATSTLKGKIQLAGDLSGTAASPTVPGLLLKANTSDVTAALALKADAADLTAGLALKENVSNKSTTTSLGTSDVLYPTQNAVKSYVDAQVASATIADATSTLKGKIQLAGDLSGTAASPTVPGLLLKANTSDVTAALALKADVSALNSGLALKENVSNKSTTTSLGTSDVLYPTQNAVKSYVDARVGSVSAISSLNGLTSSSQTFSIGTSGTDVNISSSTSTHTFNIPSASTTARGVVTTASQSFSGLKTFTNGAVVSGSLTAGGTVFPSSTGSTGQVLALSSSGTAAWTSVVSVREVADEFSSSAGQTSFTLSQAPNANSKVKMYINGVRISNTAYSVSTSTLTYTPSNNGGYSLTAGDRIQFDYYY